MNIIRIKKLQIIFLSFIWIYLLDAQSLWKKTDSVGMNRITMLQEDIKPAANNWTTKGFCYKIDSSNLIEPSTPTPVLKQPTLPYKITLNSGWFFNKGDTITPGKRNLVNIPHTFNATEALNSEDYYRGKAWYSRKINTPVISGNQQVFIRFEGVLQDAHVFINDDEVGTHKGGYTAFTINITPYLYKLDSLYLHVSVNNQYTDDIPAIRGDFNMWGGIYRDVYLIVKEPVHFSTSDYGSDGIYVSTPEVSEKYAHVEARGNIFNANFRHENIRLVQQVFNVEGREIYSKAIELDLAPNEKTPFENSFNLVQPVLWSTDYPYLYSVHWSILQNGKTLDKLIMPMGLRYFRFNENNEFLLNGKKVKLLGVSRHQDFSGLGNALEDDIHRRDVELVKEMGANFLRLAHYPQDKAVLEACDRLGLLVWKEIPLVDVGSLSTEFSKNTKEMTLEMIKQYYNHPSIIIWGTANEILSATLRQERYAHEKDKLVGAELMLLKELEQMVHKEDPHRFTTSAFHGIDDYNELGFGDIPDIVSWNLYQGWYTDKFSDFGDFIDDQHQRYPQRPLIISEYGAGSDKRINTLEPETFDFSMQYQQALHESYLRQIMDRPFIAGGLVWNLIDFGASHRNESMAHINNKGLLTYDRQKKDIFYYYKAYLRDDIPVLWIASRDWQNRKGYLKTGAKTVNQPVTIYSNLDEVTLKVNGKPMGTQKPAAGKTIFNVPFQHGKNTIFASSSDVIDYMEIDFEMVPLETKNLENESLEIAINCGSRAFYEDPKSKMIWGPDKAYSPGSWGFIKGESYRNNHNRIGHQTSIKGTYNDPLYQTFRVGMCKVSPRC